jgi:hypothetical protein
MAPTLSYCLWSLPPEGALTGCAEPRLGGGPAAGLLATMPKRRKSSL